MINFVPHPDIALCKSLFNPDVHTTWYAHNYEAIFRDIAQGRVDQIAAFRSLIKNDLFFIVHFVMEIPPANAPFVVQACHDLENDSPDGGLSRTEKIDIWAREHFKSTAGTMGLTVKRIVNNPESCTAIFSFKKPAADKFLMGIKETLEKPLMVQCFPDILYDRPETQSTSWSIQGGIRVKRASVSRKENTVEAFGLVEGMPTGGHYDHRIYDDVETADLCENPDQMEKCFSRFEMSDNLGTNGGTEEIYGTFYSHAGPLVKIRDKKKLDGSPMYEMRLKPATHDGTINGRPVLLSQERLDKLKMSKHFNTQQLCDPMPTSDIKLNFNFLKPIEPKLVPKNLIKLMMVDQAGDDDSNASSGDMWSFGVIAVKPCLEDLQGSDIYILDLECGQFGHAQAVNAIVQMYLRNGLIAQLGVEKVALSTTEIHIAEALKTRGRYLSKDSRNLVDLKPAGRQKNRRIEGALQLPLCNGKIYYSTAIPIAFIEKLKEEMDKFPFYHVDILDMLAYGYDLIRDCPFLSHYSGDEDDEGDDFYNDKVVNIHQGRSGGYG